MEISPKEILDEAYAHLLAGHIDKAASVFQYIIDNRNVYGGTAAQIAERGINWYCVPLDAILSTIEQQEFPVDIKAIVIDLFNLGTRTTEHEIETIVKSLSDHLKKMPDYIRVGKYFWTQRKIVEGFSRQILTAIIRSKEPVSLASLFKSGWVEFCRDNPAFPDHYSEIALEACLQPFDLKFLSSTLVFPETLVSALNDSLAQEISNAGEPLRIKDLIPELFPNLSTEQISIFITHALAHLDSRIVAFTSDYYLTTSLIQFDKTSFDDLFDDHYLPCSIQELLKWRFPNIETIQLSPNIQSLIETQIRNNPHLVKIGEVGWYSRKRLDKLRNQAIQALSDQNEIVSLADLLKPVVPANNTKKDLNTFVEVVASGLRLDKQVVQVTENHWLHKNHVQGLLDKAYHYLLNVKKATSKEIMLAIFGDRFPPPIKSFYHAFDGYLNNDNRFSRDRNHPDEWRVIPSGQRDNDLIVDLLMKVDFPLTEEEIVTRLVLKNPEYALGADPRFQPFPGGRWGLSSWIVLNDHAYEFLLKTRQALHENVVVGLVCKENGINRRHAFFFPDDDPRFAIDGLNRWFCRYQLKQSDLDHLLAKLDQYAGAGRKLEILLQETLRLHPDSTNAQDVLCNDPRFIHLDELWFSREKAYRNLSSADIEKIFNYFATLPIDSPAISLKNVGINALGWDGRLTNAATLLPVDDRFVENHPGFWSLCSWSTPDYSRSSHSGVAVVDPSPIHPEDDQPVELPDNLTKRKAHKGKEVLSIDIPKKYYHTLSHLDILHGNIRINGLLSKWIPGDSKTIKITDNEGNEVIAYIDETRTILNVRDWILIRNLTYGDKIYIQQGHKQDGLYVHPYGKRDERVYQEALQHQDIEKLIAEARRVNKTYHDLMIEVMGAFGMAMHREDIFQLVDYQRIAARNTIFEILSLIECPYVELRYFVPKGKGFWLFDRNKKRAYDMKMKELLDENNSLKGQLALISTRLENVSDTTDQLAKFKQRIEILESSIVTLAEEKARLTTRIHELEVEKSQADQVNDELNKRLDHLQNQISELEGNILIASGELEMLRLVKDQYQEREAQLQEAQVEIASLGVELKGFKEQASQLPILQAELAEKTTQLNNMGEALANRGDQLNTLRTELDNKAFQLTISQKNLEQEAAHISSLQVELEQTLSQVAQVQFEASHQVKAHEQETTNLNREIETAKSQLLETKACFQALMVEMGEMRESGVQLLEELKETRANLMRLEDELAKSQADNAQLKEEYEVELNNKTQALQAKIDSLEIAYAQQTQQLTVTTNRIKQIERALATPIGRLFALLQGLH